MAVPSEKGLGVGEADYGGVRASEVIDMVSSSGEAMGGWIKAGNIGWYLERKEEASEA